jgi:hypothetical protein
MNLILERTASVSFFSDMRATMQALGIAASDFDCYLSDVETTHHGEDFAPHDQWISGPELLRLDERNEIQFNWAVFSAVTVGLRPTVLAAPYIEGNQDTGRVPRSSRKCPKRSLKSHAGTPTLLMAEKHSSSRALSASEWVSLMEICMFCGIHRPFNLLLQRTAPSTFWRAL